jgi:bifunctional non-homologous end joining protein LigD
VQVVQNFVDPGGLLQVMKAHRMEGIVLKDKQSDYSLAGKDGRWRKIKIFHDLHAVVGGVIIKHNLVSSMLLGLYDESGSLRYIGHSGMGKLTESETAAFTKQAIPMVSSSNPFGHKPDRADESVWLTPRIIVKIQFMEWTPNRTMRHPTLQSIVSEAKLSDCTFKQID